MSLLVAGLDSLDPARDGMLIRHGQAPCSRSAASIISLFKVIADWAKSGQKLSFAGSGRRPLGIGPTRSDPTDWSDLTRPPAQQFPSGSA